jgi:hypothetical protein
MLQTLKARLEEKNGWSRGDGMLSVLEAQLEGEDESLRGDAVLPKSALLRGRFIAGGRISVSSTSLEASSLCPLLLLGLESFAPGLEGISSWLGVGSENALFLFKFFLAFPSNPQSKFPSVLTLLTTMELLLKEFEAAWAARLKALVKQGLSSIPSASLSSLLEQFAKKSSFNP